MEFQVCACVVSGEWHVEGVVRSVYLWAGGVSGSGILREWSVGRMEHRGSGVLRDWSVMRWSFRELECHGEWSVMEFRGVECHGVDFREVECRESGVLRERNVSGV